MLLVLDNYDSFTYNLVQELGGLGAEVTVCRNDALTVEAVAALAPEAVVISPGPCTPAQAGISVPLIRALGADTPILGVCLGHQAIGEAYGGRVVRAGRIMHGKPSAITHDGTALFAGMPSPVRVMRYHSLVVDPVTVSRDFEVSARTADGVIMGLRWKAPPGAAPMEGVQFHPESFLTVEGPRLLANFLAMRPAALTPRA
jgi:anthranilate synthase/aminodeoxychorismate synthase-like glutamine amidotransferase